MVRMRDVLKSMREVKRPGQDNRTDSGDEKSGFKFPAPASHSSAPRTPDSNQADTAPAPTEEKVDTDAPLHDHQLRASSEDQPQEAAPQPEKKASPYHSGIQVIDEFLQAAKREEPFDLDAVESVAKKFSELLADSDQLFLQAISARMSMTSMAQHSANVAIVAIKVANGLGLKPEQIVEIGMAGMVHEVGMVRIPDEIINKRGELSASEYEKIKQHPLFGRQILEAVQDEFPFLPEVIVQEHERWNGNGYPFGLRENDIHEYAQVLGLADTFVALTHMRHYRDNFIAYKAIQSIIERRNVDFSARMIKALIDVISIFPVHSLVKLNNGSIARVVQTNKKYPVRPVIELIANAKGQKVDKEETIDLSNEPMIYIVSPVLDEAAYA
ncbi:HD domain-containing protein [bacterium]|nr:HD domain-containing protein [bacterium]